MQEGSVDKFDLKRTMKHPAVKSPRAIVSVAFSKEEFEQVSDAADRDGVSLSKYIRDAATWMARVQKPFSLDAETVGNNAIVTTNG